MLEFIHTLEFHLFSGKIRQIVDILEGEQSLIHQGRQADEHRIAGKRGKALIGRVAVPGRSQRKHLPDGLTSAGEKVGELVSGRAEIPNPKWPRQRCWMKKDPARSREAHDSDPRISSMPTIGILAHSGRF